MYGLRFTIAMIAAAALLPAASSGAGGPADGTTGQSLSRSVAYRGLIKRIDRKGSAIDVYNQADKKTNTFAIRNDTKVTLDGKVAKLADLQAGFSVEVTAKEVGGKLVATAVVARKKHL